MAPTKAKAIYAATTPNLLKKGAMEFIRISRLYALPTEFEK